MNNFYLFKGPEIKSLKQYKRAITGNTCGNSCNFTFCNTVQYCQDFQPIIIFQAYILFTKKVRSLKDWYLTANGIIARLNFSETKFWCHKPNEKHTFNMISAIFLVYLLIQLRLTNASLQKQNFWT